ncbi:hypothetical protein N499_0215A, partial [Wolbachia pipientis wVitA]
MTNYL